MTTTKSAVQPNFKLKIKLLSSIEAECYINTCQFKKIIRYILVDLPLIWRTIVTAFAVSVLKFQSYLVCI